MTKWIVRIVIAAAVLIGLVYGGILLWTKVINPPEEKLSTDDLSQVLAETTSTVATESSPAPTDAPTGVDGTWTATNESTLGYRVKEVLGGVDTEGVGRTNAVTGSLTIAGTSVTAADFTVDVASITSDSSRRDGQFNGRIMDTATYPTATFVLTSPIELGSIPADGEQTTVDASGDLTLRGTTNAVTFPLTAEYANGRIGVFGNISVTFADYGIPNPSNGFAVTGDDGLLEFVLVFTR
ncbi:MAG: YceI family protein [Actinomycetota bacterium]|nr:YceI family protein [Actinomycetota bacterium]MDA2972265.1 YceI family protein [Actinomycetota bacterium]MDA3002247.1 YceI family protein [Actinomycetota bacterium]